MKNYEIKKILVPVDFSGASEMATSEALTLAKLLKAEVFLIHVMEGIGYISSLIPEKDSISPTISELSIEVERKMDNLKNKIIKDYDIIPEIFIASGHIHTEIISFSENKKIDLIVMGTHGATGYKEFFIGTNAHRVVTLSEIPVLTIRNKNINPVFGNIMIPIDNSIHSREKVNLAMTIAELFGSKIHIIGLPYSNDEQELNKFKTKLGSVEEIVQSNKIPYISTIVHGDNLAEATLKYATDNKCDLIVINTGHESRLTGIFMGAFAKQIVNHSRVAVLSFRHTKSHYNIEVSGFGI